MKMNTKSTPCYHVSNSSWKRYSLADNCSVKNANGILLTKYRSEGGLVLSYKQVVLTLHGGINCPPQVSPRKSHSRDNTIHFYRRKKLNAFKIKSAEGTDKSVSEDHNSGHDKVEKLTEKLTSDDDVGAPKRWVRETVGKLDNGLVSDSCPPGKLIVEQKDGEGKITPADFLSSNAEFSGDPGSEERDCDGISFVKFSPHGEDLSFCKEREHESEYATSTTGGGEVTDDYSAEPVMGRNGEIEYVTRIMVPRQRYIRIPKAELVDALSMFLDQHEAKLPSMCAFLELVLHAKHKFILEELRADYRATHTTSDGGSSDFLKADRTTAASASEKSASSRRTSGELTSLSMVEAQRPPCDPPEDVELVNGSTKMDNGLTKDIQPKWKAWGINFLNVLNWRKDTELENENGDIQTEISSHEGARTASAKRFQRNFLNLLESAQFEGLSAEDLELTAALNSDYLLTLPIAVDWELASRSNAIIYRRGYAKEQQKGLLLGAKVDYLQSAFLREIMKGLTRPLITTGRWFMQKWKTLRNDPEGRVLAETVERWVEEPLQPEGEKSSEDTSEMPLEVEEFSKESEMDLPIWKAAQQAVPRYEAVLSSAGSRGLLLRSILVSMGLLPLDSIPTSLSVEENSNGIEPHLRPNFLSRVSMKDIWLPASKVAVGENSWKRFLAAFSVFFSQVTLQEPAFEELVLLYSVDGQNRSEASSLQLQMYKTIPLPDLKIVFPSKKLSFRLIDTLRLDVTTFVGLTAFLYNYHFEGVLSSPSAIALDVIAASALLVFVARAALGYKQTWDRYQLLVNKTLYEKTLANEFGVVHFLLDASEEQQFKEVMLAFSILSHEGKDEGMSKEQLANACERFLYYRCKEQTEMPVDNAIKNLLELGLVKMSKNLSSPSQRYSEVCYRALTYDEGLETLKQYWESIPSNISSLMTR